MCCRSDVGCRKWVKISHYHSDLENLAVGQVPVGYVLLEH